MKIVLDTNCLIVIIPKKSAYRKVYDLIRNGKIKLAITNEILTEYEEILTDFYSETVAQNVIRQILILKNIEHFQVYFNWHLINNDEDDNKFVDCAIAANVDMIVTNDHHYNELDKVKFPKVKHITIQKFMDLL